MIIIGAGLFGCCIAKELFNYGHDVTLIEKDSDIIHTVRPGERLDLLAYKYYGDVGLWWVISRANRLDPSDIGLDASTELRIPKEVGEVLRAYKSLNLG